MVMIDGCEQNAGDHDRMPTILGREDRIRWTSGTTEDAFAMWRVWEGAIGAERTAQC